MGQQGGREKEGGKKERDTGRKETDGLQTRTFEIQVDIHNDSKWANLSQCTQYRHVGSVSIAPSILNLN